MSIIIAVTIIITAIPKKFVYSSTNDYVFYVNVSGYDLSRRDISDEQLAEMVTNGRIQSNVTHLVLHSNQITDITPLRSLINLEKLVLGVNRITDITPLSGLTKLERLDLFSNFKITDITPLSELINLKDLRIQQNQISDLTPLSELKNLELLFIGHNPISDITPLKNLTKLRNLSLGYSGVNDLSSLLGLSNLKKLDLLNTSVTLGQVNALQKTLPNCEIEHDAESCYFCGRDDCRQWCKMPIKPCFVCKICESGNPSVKGCILGNAEPGIFDFMEVLLYIVGMDNEIFKCSKKLYAALITPESQATGKPTIFDGIEILTIIVDM